MNEIHSAITCQRFATTIRNEDVFGRFQFLCSLSTPVQEPTSFTISDRIWANVLQLASVQLCPLLPFCDGVRIIVVVPVLEVGEHAPDVPVAVGVADIDQWPRQLKLGQILETILKKGRQKSIRSNESSSKLKARQKGKEDLDSLDSCMTIAA